MDKDKERIEICNSRVPNAKAQISKIKDKELLRESLRRLRGIRGKRTLRSIIVARILQLLEEERKAIEKELSGY